MTEGSKKSFADGLRGYPRPLMERAEWTSLDGEWDFHIDPKALITGPQEVAWDAKILVPFSPETEASGIADARVLLRGLVPAQL